MLDYLNRIIQGERIKALFAALFLISYLLVYADDYSRIESPNMSIEDPIGEIVNGNVYKQKVVCENPYFESFALVFGTYNKTNLGEIEVGLYQDNILIQQWEIDGNALRDKAYYTFFLDNKIEESSNEIFYITIQSEAEESNAVTLYSTNEGDGLELNGHQVEGISLVYKIYYHTRMINVPFIYCFLVLLSVLGGMFYINNKVKRIENQFVIFFIGIAFLFLGLNMPLGAPDEVQHFCRAFEITEGNLISSYNNGNVGNMLPFVGIDFSNYIEGWELFLDNRAIQISQEREFLSFWNTAVYFPVTYLPQALGILISRLITDKIVVIIYIAKLFNLLFAAILFYLAIKIAPFGKRVIFLVALIPMNMQEAVSLSPDTMITALVCLMFAYVLYLRHVLTRTLGRIERSILLLLCLTISLYKLIYMPLCLFVCLIPWQRFGNKNKKKMYCIITVLLSISVSFIWLSIANTYVIKKGINMSLQLSFVINHPIQYYITILRTWLTSGLDWLLMMFGYKVGPSNNVLVCGALLLIYPIAARNIIQKAIASSDKIEDKEVRIFSVMAFTGMVLLLLITEYLAWTWPYQNIISGVQGRYFIPLLFIAFLAVKNEYFVENSCKVKSLSLLTVGIINACVCISLFYSYF